MKIVELLNKVQMPLSNEESDILGLFEANTSVDRNDLTERQIYIANQLVNKDVLFRRNNNGRITYHKKIS